MRTHGARLGLATLGLMAFACSDSVPGGESADVAPPDEADAGVLDDASPQAVPCASDEECVAAFPGLPTCQATLCDAALGECVVRANKNYSPCDDLDPCTVEDTCLEGVCIPGRARPCYDGNGCTDDGCDPDSGCVFIANTAPCDDGNSCTEEDACADGMCLGSATAACACVADADCGALGDGNLCNGTLACTDDLCQVVDGSEVTCDTSQDTTCQRMTCDPGTGLCQFLDLNDLECTDGNPCTTDDVCVTGQCVGSGSECPCEVAEDCALFQDEDLCNGDVTCLGGVCATDPDTAVSCDASPEVCAVTLCVPGTGACEAIPAVDGAPCDDGDPCSQGGQCAAGACQGKALDCDDGDPCTTDQCDGDSGCMHETVDCDDSDACTSEECDQQAGCIYSAVDCDDSDACTSDGCDATLGCANEVLTCDDGDACTTDSCGPDLGCVHSPVDGCGAPDPCAGLAADFDGASCIEIPGALASDFTAHTIEFWIRPATEDQQGFILDKVQDKDDTLPGFRMRYLMWNLPGKTIPWILYEEVKSTGLFHGLGTIEPYSAGGWKHYAIVREASGLARVFIDGEAQGLNQMNQEKFLLDQSNDHALIIGCQDLEDGFFQGRLDELRISAGKRYAASFDPPTAPLETDGETLVLYHFEEGQGAAIVDSSGNGYDGTWHGTPSWSQDSPVLTGCVEADL